MKVRRVPVDELHEDPANVRVHDDANLAAIQASLQEFGQVEPIIVQKGTKKVIGGNGRLRVLKRIGAKHVDIVEVELSDVRATALGIALNRTAELAAWDPKALDAMLKSLEASEFDVEGILRFTPQDVEKLLTDIVVPDPTQVQDAPIIALPANPLTKPGDVWRIGDHRLICADARKPQTWNQLLTGKPDGVADMRRVTVAVTSPPYADKRRYDEKTEFRPIPPDEYVAWYQPIAENIKRTLAPDGSYFLNIRAGCDDGQRLLYVDDLKLAHARSWGYRFIDDFVWVHGGTPRAVDKRFKNGWEPVYQFAVGEDYKFRPDRVMKASSGAPEWGGRHPSQNEGQGLLGVRPTKTPFAKLGMARNQPKGSHPNWESLQGRAGSVPGSNGEDATTGGAYRRVLTKKGHTTQPGAAGGIEGATSTRSGAKWKYVKDDAAILDRAVVLDRGKATGNTKAEAGRSGIQPETSGAKFHYKQVRRVGRPIGGIGGSSDPAAQRGQLGGVEVDLAYPSNVLSLGRNREALGHSAAFPVSLPAFFIKAYSDPGDLVLDPFMGSGSTMIAAAQLQRRAYGIELSPAYCDIIVQRVEKLLNLKATRT